MNTHTLILAFALVLILEGLGPALVPKKWRRYLNEIAKLDCGQLRIIGIVMILLGALLFHFNK